MVTLVHAPDNFRLRIGRRVRVLLASQGDDHATIVIAPVRELVLILQKLDPSPLSPEVKPCCRLNHLRGVCAADTGAHLREVEALVFTSDELHMGDSAHHTKRSDAYPIQGLEL